MADWLRRPTRKWEGKSSNPSHTMAFFSLPCQVPGFERSVPRLVGLGSDTVTR